VRETLERNRDHGEARARKSISLAAFGLQATIRRRAANLYQLLTSDHNWKCQGEDHKHMLNLRLDTFIEQNNPTENTNRLTVAF
jgi:hypothetical protein